MAKKNKAAAREEKRAAAEYYKLNVQAVEDLVTADETNSPPVSEEELRKYQSGPKLKVADWVKVLLIKAWFAGAVCFFFLWGIGYYLRDQLDQIFVISVAWGMVTDLLTNNLLRFIEKTPGKNDPFMMCPPRKFISFPLNLLYGVLVIFCVVTTYHGINTLLISLMGADTMPLGVEPILFGVITTAWDTLFIKMKLTFRRMASEAKQQALRDAKKQP